MRTSRDVLRPLVALAVVVATVALVSNVAAYRTATTAPQRANVPCPQADVSSHSNDGHRTPAAEACRGTTAQSKARATDEDRDGSDERNEARRDSRSGRSTSHVVVVTASGAS